MSKGVVMEKIISNELLSEVLGVDVIDTKAIRKVLEYYIDVGGITDIRSINIYELAHKCKEWAKKIKFIYMNKGKPLSETSAGLEIRVSVKQLYNDWYGVDIVTLDSRFRTISTLNHKTFHTEHEAIFKACQWILENKEK